MLRRVKKSKCRNNIPVYVCMKRTTPPAHAGGVVKGGNPEGDYFT